MPESITYNVIINGELLAGFESAQVSEAFSVLFKISPEKASKIIRAQRVVKKDVDHKSAELYKQKLESIGLVVILKKNAQPVESDHFLSLVPTDEERKLAIAAQVSGDDSASQADFISCPKCAKQQPVTNNQCTGCGVYMHKVRSQLAEVNQQPQTPPQPVEEATVVFEDESLSSKSLAAGAIAALVGALIWSLIANISGYEFGLVAWGIGGVVGFAVAASGSRGETAGITCGALALLAILGGKYLIYSGLKDDFAEDFAGSIDDVEYVYDYEMEAATKFETVLDDESLRQFMIDYDYSEYEDSQDVTEEEISYFHQYNEPRLHDFSYNKPTLEEWHQSALNESLENISTLDLMTEEASPVDLVFLLLGVATAYRLGRGSES